MRRPFDTYPYFRRGERLLFAHRGGSRRFPENTEIAFRGAIDLGFNQIETDIHQTSDGHLVIFHDADLDRTTNGVGPIRARTLAELRQLDAAYRFTRNGQSFPYRGRGARIMTLEEAFEIDDEVHFNIEMKGDDPSLADGLWKFIRHYGVYDRVLAAAANDALTRRFRSLAGDRVVTSAGVKGILRFWAAVRARMHTRLQFDFHALQVPQKHGVLTVVEPRFVDAAHACGLAVHVWTVDDPLQMRRLRDIGVDGIMTDVPEVLLHTLAS